MTGGPDEGGRIGGPPGDAGGPGGGTPGRGATTGELIKALEAECGVCITRQTVWTYTKQGLPHERTLDGERRFSLPEAVAWIKANRITSHRGGKRPGAGRKKKGSGDQGIKGSSESGNGNKGISETQAAAAPTTTQIPPPLPPPPGSGVGACAAPGPSLCETKTPDQWLADALRDGDKGGLTKADADREHRIHETYIKRLEAEKLAGNLVALDETLDAWADQLAALKIHMESAAERLAPEAQSRLGLSHQQARDLQQMIVAWSRRVLEGMAADPGAEAVRKVG